jgi:hypothetical protein
MTLLELIKISKENKNKVYVIRDINNTLKNYLCGGKFYRYEFCGNLNWVIKESNKVSKLRITKHVCDQWFFSESGSV